MLRRYLVKRLLIAIPSLLIASLIVFTLPRLIPGDVVMLMLAEKAYAKDLEELEPSSASTDRCPCSTWSGWAGSPVVISANRSGRSGRCWRK